MVGHVYLGWHDLYKIGFNLIVIDTTALATVVVTMEKRQVSTCLFR